RPGHDPHATKESGRGEAGGHFEERSTKAADALFAELAGDPATDHPVPEKARGGAPTSTPKPTPEPRPIAAGGAWAQRVPDAFFDRLFEGLARSQEPTAIRTGVLAAPKGAQGLSPTAEGTLEPPPAEGYRDASDLPSVPRQSLHPWQALALLVLG